MILDIRPMEYHLRNRLYDDLGLPIVHWETVRPEPIPSGWLEPADFDAIIITSPVAVTLMPNGWSKHVGYASAAGSAAALRDTGFAKVIDAGPDRRNVVNIMRPGDFRRAFYPSSSTVYVTFPPELATKIVRSDIYRVVAVNGVPDDVKHKIQGRRIIAPLLSPGGARTLARLLNAAPQLNVTVDAVGIRPDIFDAPGPWRNKIVAAEPTVQGVVASIRDLKAADRHTT